MSHPIFTIGHSTRPFETFAALLKASGVETVADVRATPRSRRYPQYNHDALRESLGAHGFGYVHFPELGGRRERKGLAEPSANTFWEHGGFRNYADYALTQPFRDGLERLRRLGRERRCAVMCAEADWRNCHRRIVADYLLASGEAVFHILDHGRVEQGRLTPEARIEPEGGLIYEGDQKVLPFEVARSIAEDD